MMANRIAPIIKGGVPWTIASCGRRRWGSPTPSSRGSVVTNQKRNLSWESDEKGVETRTYEVEKEPILNKDGGILVEGTEHIRRKDAMIVNQNKHMYWRHVPYYNGEVKNERPKYSSIIWANRNDKPSFIFGRCISTYFEGVPDPNPTGELKKKVDKLNPEFWTTGAGEKYVGYEGLNDVFIEALNTINMGKSFSMFSEACCLENIHLMNVKELHRLYSEAVKEQEVMAHFVAACSKNTFTLRADATVITPLGRGRMVVWGDGSFGEEDHVRVTVNPSTKRKIYTEEPILMEAIV